LIWFRLEKHGRGAPLTYLSSSLSEIPDAVVGLQPTLRRRVSRLGARYCAAMLFRMEAITTVWLVKPEAPQGAEGVADCVGRSNRMAPAMASLVRECLEAARARGLSAEETYVFLAYQALLRLEETHQRHIYLSNIAPFLESVPSRPGVMPSRLGVTARIVAHVERLVRSVIDLALRTERAAAQYTRISLGRGS